MKISRALLLVPLLILAACRPSTPTPDPTATPVPPTPTATPTLGDIVFEDGFGDPNSGWDTVDDEFGRIAYEDGVLVVRNEGLGAMLFTGPALSFDDGIVEVLVAFAGGSEDNWMGIACRMQENGDAYAFLISADGFYVVARYSWGELAALDGPTDDAAVRAGTMVNLVRVECAGENLRLWVNDTLVSELTDSTFASGETGLLVDAWDENFTEVRFDDFVVWGP